MYTSIFSDILNLFYPNACVQCSKSLHTNETLLCIQCRHDLPYAYYHEKNNPLKKLFFGKLPIVSATSLFLFHKNGTAQTLIHLLKYKQQEYIGSFLGYLLAEELKKNQLFDTIDMIIPVPIHQKRITKRGYNQLTLLGKTLSKELQIPFNESILIKTEPSRTQTLKNKLDRRKNTENSFKLTDTSVLENKKILLLDDVITTGATIEACARELLKTKNVAISIASVAHTPNF